MFLKLNHRDKSSRIFQPQVEEFQPARGRCRSGRRPREGALGVPGHSPRQNRFFPVLLLDRWRAIDYTAKSGLFGRIQLVLQ